MKIAKFSNPGPCAKRFFPAGIAFLMGFHEALAVDLVIVLYYHKIRSESLQTVLNNETISPFHLCRVGNKGTFFVSEAL